MARPNAGRVDMGTMTLENARKGISASSTGAFVNRPLRAGHIAPDIRMRAETVAREARAAGRTHPDPAIRRMFIGGSREVHPNSTAARAAHTL